MNQKVDQYLIDGCGRCSLYRTLECKVHTWAHELRHLREIVLDSGLKEELKWSQPCYTIQNKNVLLVTAFKEYATIAFFKGALLTDKEGLLTAPGKSTQSARHMRFTQAEEIVRLESTIRSYIAEAIEVEKSGLKVKLKKRPEPVPEELLEKMEEMPAFKAAFEGLTMGRQRGYILHFSQPKQSKTRSARIERCIPQILRGEGIHDAYRNSRK